MTVKETQNTLVFEVAEKASKIEVKQAVEALFKIKVDSVRTVADRRERAPAAAATQVTAPIGRRRMFA